MFNRRRESLQEEQQPTVDSNSHNSTFGEEKKWPCGRRSAIPGPDALGPVTRLGVLGPLPVAAHLVFQLSVDQNGPARSEQRPRIAWLSPNVSLYAFKVLWEASTAHVIMMRKQ